MTADGNVKEVIMALVDKIKAGYEPEGIILFGSYAYGRPDKGSDIDLLIIKSTGARPIDRRVVVRKIVSGPGRRVPLELMVLTPEEMRSRLKIGDQFLQEIMEKGEVLYAA